MAHSPATIAAPASAIQVENSDDPVIFSLSRQAGDGADIARLMPEAEPDVSNLCGPRSGKRDFGNVAMISYPNELSVVPVRIMQTGHGGSGLLCRFEGSARRGFWA